MLPPGSRLAHYEIRGTLGAGGMGEVYYALDTRLNRQVAIKILPDAFAASSDRVMRFRREAQTLAALNHSNIAQIFGIEEAGGTDRTITRALVMELVPGETLAERIARGALPVDEAVEVARQLAAGLEAAHDAGVIHRDLKPANVKLRPDGTVKILDFGLAKGLEEPDHHLTPAAPTITSPALTEAGLVLGTAAYMSPEQARGRQVDKRTDIWSFGCVLFEMLTGTAAFTGDTLSDVIAAVVKSEPDWTRLPANLAANVRRLLRRCLHKDRTARLRDIGDARLELMGDDAAESTAIVERSPYPGLAMAVIAAVAVIVAAWLWLRAPAPSATAAWSAVRIDGPPIALDPAISPDDQLLALQTIVDGQSQIAVLKPDVGTWRVITSDRTRGAVVRHGWAPDGSRIYYDRQAGVLNGIFSVPALGGDERLVLENAGYPVAAPNGDLLFQRANGERQLQLHRFVPSTGRIEALPALPDTRTLTNAVVVSKDGRFAYFYGRPLATPSAPAAFQRLELDSGGVEPIVGVPVQDPNTLKVHYRTGDVFIGGRAGDAFQIVRMSPEMREPRQVMAIPEVAVFDVDRDGGVFVTVTARPVEIHAFTERATEPVPTTPEMNIRQEQAIVPLHDGTFLVGSRAGGRDRLLVIHPGGAPTFLFDGDDTRMPAAAAGPNRVVMMMGSATSPDIAIVDRSVGRLVRRFPAPTADIRSIDASPDGRTLYYTADGSVWALPSGGGTPARVAAGDSLTVDAESGDLIVKVEDPARIRLLRLRPAGGGATEIPLRGNLQLVQSALMPGAVRQGRLVLAVTAADSFFFHPATVDLGTGAVTKLTDVSSSDINVMTWRSDGVAVGFGYGLRTSLWRFSAATR